MIPRFGIEQPLQRPLVQVDLSTSKETRMSGSRSLRTQLLVSALAVILLHSLTAQAMPLSWRTARYRRTSPSTEIPTQSGTIMSDRATERRPTGSSQSNQDTQDGDSDDATSGNESCSDNAPPENVINGIREHLQEKPHPMFLISEMAEMLHRKLYYRYNYPNECDHSQQVEDKTIDQVRRKILQYLNNNRLPTETDVACPPRYNITYYPARYPRYLVQVECTASSGVSDHNGCQSLTCGSGRECRPYQLDDMLYLTKDQTDCHSQRGEPDPSGWSTCRAIEVGVGCKCSE